MKTGVPIHGRSQGHAPTNAGSEIDFSIKAQIAKTDRGYPLQLQGKDQAKKAKAGLLSTRVVSTRVEAQIHKKRTEHANQNTL